MAQYASRADLARLGLPASALIPPLGMSQPDFEAAVDDQLAKTSARVDDYLRGRYTVPLTGVLTPTNTFNASIVKAVTDLAAYDLLVWRGFNPGEFDASYGERAAATIRWLENVAKGVVSLDLPPPGGDGGVIVATGVPIFASSDRRGWGDDESLIGEPRGNFWGPPKYD